MSVPTFAVHVDATPAGPSWWATSDAHPGLSVAAPTLTGLRERIAAYLTEAGADAAYVEELVGMSRPLANGGTATEARA